MKNLVQYITEHEIKSKKTTIKKFMDWYVDDNKLTVKNFKGLNLHELLDYFEDTYKMDKKDVVDLIKKHYNDRITLQWVYYDGAYIYQFNIDEYVFRLNSYMEFDK